MQILTYLKIRFFPIGGVIHNIPLKKCLITQIIVKKLIFYKIIMIFINLLYTSIMGVLIHAVVKGDME